MRLLEFLREELFLTGTKEGCGEGECGACTIIMDGQPVKTCLVPVVKANGSTLTTIEGVAKNGEFHPVQAAFQHCGGAQCGFCTPGMVMSTVAALEKHPDLNDQELREAIAGNLCRCTGYTKIFDSIELARDIMSGKVDQASLDTGHPESYIGHRQPRVDGRAKLTGAAKYAADINLPGQLYMRIVHPPFAHARILDIDTSAAEAYPGVEAVLTYKDVPGKNLHGVTLVDQPVFCQDKVFYMGDSVAAVVAETEEIAHKASALVRIKYEMLPGVFDAESAIAEGAPILHEGRHDGNIIRHVKIRRGDVDAAFAQADRIVESVYQTQRVEHSYMEPEAALAYVDPDGMVTLLTPGQNLTHHRHGLAEILNMPVHRIRLIQTVVGGGFGGKEDMSIQPQLALAAMKTGRPVKCVWSREESFLASTKRHPLKMFYKTGLSRDGRIIAQKIRLLGDAGGYGGASPGVLFKAAILAAGAYEVPNVWVDSLAIHTNNTPGGPMRGYGAPQPTFAVEVQMDRCAEAMGMDPIEFRKLNAMVAGSPTHTGQTLERSALIQCLDTAASAAGWQPKAWDNAQNETEVLRK
jgi:nicotinate dehydrogenase large molybdopterin subunit